MHLIVNERREAGASLPHTHAQLYALDFVPAAIARERERFGAYATRTMGGNLLADLVQEEVRRRERIVAIDEETVLMAPYGARVPFQLMIAPRTPRARFEDDGPIGAHMLHDALTPAGAAARREPAAEPVGADGAARRRALLLADRHPAAADPPGRARARGRRAPEHRAARAGRGRAARSGVRALVQRVSRASVSVDGERRLGDRARAARAARASGSEDDRARRRLAGRQGRARCAIFPDADGRMNEPLGDREVLCVSQFTLYGDARRGNRPSYVAAAAPERRRAAVRALLRAARARRGACSGR